MDAKKQLENISIIESVAEIELTDKRRSVVQPKISDWRLERMTNNAKRVSAFAISYTVSNHTVKGCVVQPKKRRKSPLPCIVYNRGGSGEFGVIKLERLFGDIAECAKAGYMVVASQYSGNAGGEGKDEMGGNDLEDVFALYNILQEYPQADETRIGMYGISRGGMMAYMALKRAGWIKAAVTVGGVTDLFRSEQLRPEMKAVYKKMFGGSKKEKEKRSALHWPEQLPADVPILLMHGSADWRVSPLDSIELATKLYEQRAPVRLIVFEGADHGISEYREERNRQRRRWFDRFIKNSEPLPNTDPHGD